MIIEIINHLLYILFIRTTPVMGNLKIVGRSKLLQTVCITTIYNAESGEIAVRRCGETRGREELSRRVEETCK